MDTESWSYFQCSICHERKPAEAFHHRTRQLRTGPKTVRASQCKKCEHSSRTAYNHTAVGQEHLKRQQTLLVTDPIRAARHEAYMNSEAAKLARKTYETSEKGKARMDKFLESDKGRKYRSDKWHRHRERRATRIETAGDTLAPWQWRKVRRAYKAYCAYCDCRTQQLEMDHVIPISKGGANTKENVVPCCSSCNDKKADQLGWIPNPPRLPLVW
jgi:5-methylcytosine-specific restriction endonuclease McrA